MPHDQGAGAREVLEEWCAVVVLRSGPVQHLPGLDDCSLALDADVALRVCV